MSKADTRTPARRNWLRLIVVLLALLLLSGLAAGAVALGTRGAGHAPTMPIFRVKPGPLLISVTEAGTIQAREQIVIKSEVEGTSTILYLVAEGTRVKEGDMLVELDASKLADQLVEQQIRLQNAQAAFIRSRENLAVVQNQAQADIARAELDLQFAHQDLKKYVEGEYPNQVNAAESKIALAEAELKRATEKLQWSGVLNDEKYISKTELEADQLAQRKAELDLRLTRQDLDLLKQYTQPRRLAELQSGVTQAEMALERIKRKAAADIVQAQADLKAKEAEAKQQQDKLEKNEKQIEKTKIRAPRAGMVVYATSTQASWRGNASPLEEGQQVRERQELIYLPTADVMTAKIKIHEADLDKVSRGMSVRMTVDALPGQVFTGTIARIAPLPDAAAMFMNPDLKVYDTDVHIDPNEGGLRTGMSCQVQILAAYHPQASFVPVQAVVRTGAQPTVYVKSGQSFEPRAIKIGLDNKRMVHVLDGLAEGDQVLLTPPLAAGAVQHESPQIPDSLVGSAATSQPAADAAETAGGAPGARAASPEPDHASQAEIPADVQRPQAERTSGRRRMSDMTPEEREAARKRFESMSPEEREALRQQWSGSREGGERSGGGRGRGRENGPSAPAAQENQP